MIRELYALFRYFGREVKFDEGDGLIFTAYDNSFIYSM